MDMARHDDFGRKLIDLPRTIHYAICLVCQECYELVQLPLWHIIYDDKWIGTEIPTLPRRMVNAYPGLVAAHACHSKPHTRNVHC
jgi:hypothetical protein